MNMIDKSSLLGMLGLAARARALVLGETACIQAVRSGQAKIIFLASDVGMNGRKKLLDKCAYYHVPVVQVLNKDELSQAIGNKWRAAVGVTNHHFAHKLAQLAVSQDGGEAFD